MATEQKSVVALQAEIATLRAALSARNTITMKVSEKGGVSVYGLQRMPVTLYAGQWTRLLEKSDAIKAFIAANSASLSVKPIAAIV